MTEQGAHFARQMVALSGYYWFRPKDNRIEFYPEISLATTLDQKDQDPTTDLFVVSAGMNVDFYLFDLINDCDCPTFSKQGSFFTRGFFIETSVFADYEILDYRAPDNSSSTSSGVTIRGGLGVGLDIGVSDMVTITPLGYIHAKPVSSWDELNNALEPSLEEKPNGIDWYRGFALRVIFRPDYRRRYR